MKLDSLKEGFVQTAAHSVNLGHRRTLQTGSRRDRREVQIAGTAVRGVEGGAFDATRPG